MWLPSPTASMSSDGTGSTRPAKRASPWGRTARSIWSASPICSMCFAKSTSQPGSWPVATPESALERLHAVFGTQQQDVGRARGEQAIGDHADDIVDLRFEVRREADHQVVHV